MKRSEAKENCFTVCASGIPQISEKQAECFAMGIYSEIKKYIEENQAEFEQWQAEQAGAMDEVA